MTGAAVELVDLRREYRSGDEVATALDGIDLSVQSGSAVALVGPSGSGKSTLMMILAGLDRATSGRVTVDGIDLTGLSERQLLQMRATRIAVTVQRPDRNLLGYGTALDNVAFAQGRRRRDDPRPTPHELLDRVGLARTATRATDRLSGGERQRLALAVALASGAGLLLLDEPTSQLDEHNRDAVVALLLELHAQYRPTLIAVTHDLAVSRAFSRVVTMRDGRVVA